MSQISIVQRNEQEKIARMIVNPKKRKTKFSHLSYGGQDEYSQRS